MIETTVMVRLVFHQPPRQTEGLLSSLLDLMGVDLPVPDHPGDRQHRAEGLWRRRVAP
ncbi:hypothetical protein D3877_25225 [Azospirillum cavernae]|uniref:Transposase DDE domain-containing protein n=1 Tax=Azospirillum cavernae TaxID=2320860 RepID=A0A418VQ52_9PROT|nr:hypothetical protein D3877_25225 [Azospirillum cavernae]